MTNLFGSSMWQDYEAAYRRVLEDPIFLAWRDQGARRKAANIMRVCHGLNPGKVLDIGCGTGAVLRVLHDRNFAQEYFCTDLSPSAIAFARGSCPAFAGRAFAGPADALPFSDCAFDVAILSHVIEHMENPLAALREAVRVARFVVVEVPTEKVAVNFVRTRILRRQYPSIAEAGHVQFWSPSSITAFLEQDAGLEIIAHYRDLLDGEVVPKTSGGLKHALKRALLACLPASTYARLLTTHATFLCRLRTATAHREQGSTFAVAFDGQFGPRTESNLEHP